MDGAFTGPASMVEAFTGLALRVAASTDAAATDITVAAVMDVHLLAVGSVAVMRPVVDSTVAVIFTAVAASTEADTAK
jgi:hypothetical protein